MTKLEEEMYDAQGECIHMTEHAAICVPCAVKAAQQHHDQKDNGRTEFRRQAKERIHQLEAQLGEAARGNLSKREHFAAMMMHAVMVGDLAMDGTSEEVASMAVAYADALLRELEKKR